MRRAVLMAVATMSLLGANAMADNFTFSFTGGPGTVTGEIFGLKNDGVLHPATEVLITSYPASLGSISDLVATDWGYQLTNDFKETNGTITAANFDAVTNPQVDELAFNLNSLLPSPSPPGSGFLQGGRGSLRGASSPSPRRPYPSHSRGFYS